MIQIYQRTTLAAAMLGAVLPALPFTLIVAACSAADAVAPGLHVTEGYGSSSPPLISPPPAAPGAYAPYDHLTEALRRTNGP
jgi:hypothetical protein